MHNTVVDIFNSFHRRLQFTIEEGVDNRLNFLETSQLFYKMDVSNLIGFINRLSLEDTSILSRDTLFARRGVR